jgi:hypothetical protein
MVTAILAVVLLQAQAAGSRPFAIVDPVLGMTAWTVPVPAGWTAEGTMLPGSSCVTGTSPVFKAVSPDGRSGANLLPRTDWAWGAGVRSADDCLPWHEAVSAKRFLTYLVHIRKVGFVREEPVPELAAARSQHGETIDMARFLVRYSVDGQVVDEQLFANVTCSGGMVAAMGEQHSCSALVTRWFAPAGKLDAMLPTYRSMRFALDPDWWNAWQAALADRFRRLTATQTARLLNQGRLAQGQRMQAHEAYMASAQHGYDVHNDQFRRGQFQKQSRNDDFVDYVLDCQRAYSGSVRVSVGYNCPNRQTP